jgi:hypothetical protein
MVTALQLRSLALAMPEATEWSHFRQPDFRVRNKIFAGLSRDRERGNLKLKPETQAALVSAKPAVFSPCEGAWGKSGWTYVELAHVTPKELEPLVVEAWRLIAPKGLVLSWDEAQPAPKRRATRRPEARNPTR